MAKFVFEFEAVLKHRAIVELGRQLEVAALERERGAIEDRIRSYQRQLQREKQDLRDHLVAAREGRDESWSGGVDLRAVRLQANASLYLVALAQRAVIELAGAHKRLDAARLRLIEATTARRAVEVLRQRRLEAWEYEQKRREAAAMDELAVMSAGRREDAA